MLILKLQNYENQKEAEFTWEVGGIKTFIDWRDCEAVELTADGEELKFVLNQFEGIPVRLGFHKPDMRQTWHGDFAKFIWTNL